MCTVASLPLPGIVLADHDISQDETSPFPGQRITCQRLDFATGSSALWHAVRLGAIALELLG